MGLMKSLRDVFAQRKPLSPRNLGEHVKDVSFRVMEEADIPLCLSIYRANEARHFPQGFIDEYETRLRGRQLLNLIAMRGGEAVGCGGLVYDANGNAWFCFGMVAPAHQRKGVGTALMLARVALLTPVDGWCAAGITAVPGSVSFYRRFGFTFLPATTDGNGTLLSIAILDVPAAEVEACRTVLAERRIFVPNVHDDIPRLPPPAAPA
jgi:[ribosomal protein S18]-alanine N-acetyltransferase